MTENARNRWIGGACTVAVHCAVLCILLCIVIKKEPVTADAGGGVLVQFGNINEATGMFEPDNAPAAEAVEEEAASAAEEPLITQEEEETVPMAQEEPAKKEQTNAEKNKQQENKQIDNRLKSAFGKGVAASEGKGSGLKGNGSEGNPFGATAEGSLQGIGGYGGYSLGGRGLLGDLPRPEYDSSNDAGTIVVDITVDNKGRVVNARVRVSGSEGSAASNLNLRNSAVRAARRATFEPVSAGGNQQGYIIYYFRQQ